jgi:hypothetical protein
MKLAKMMPKSAKLQIMKMYKDEIMRIKAELEKKGIFSTTYKKQDIEITGIVVPEIERTTLEFEKKIWDETFDKIANEDFMKLIGG